jgi:hypothetical protein
MVLLSSMTRTFRPLSVEPPLGATDPARSSVVDPMLKNLRESHALEAQKCLPAPTWGARN